MLGYVYACLFVVFLALFGIVFLWPRKATKLGFVRNSEKIFYKLNREISIFNKLKLQIPSKHRLPNEYIRWLGRLHVNPKERITSSDPIERLMYLYAATKLYNSTFDQFRKRQLYKNILYAFGTKKCFQSLVPYTIRPLKLSRHKTLFAIRQPLFKYLQTKFVTRKENLRFSHSYTVTESDGAVVKNFVSRIGATYVDCLDIKGKYCFEHNFNFDKMKCTFSHTSDTFYCTYRGVTTAILVGDTPRINFETNIATKEPNLTLFINLKNGGSIRILKSDTKAGAVGLVSQIKALQRLDYLQAKEEVKSNTQVETLFKRASLSKFVSGEKLKQRMAVAMRYVPTLNLPTIVFDIVDADELFGVIDNFENFKKITQAGVNFNVIVMYSSQNDIVREFIGAFTDKGRAIELIRSGVFLFFIDKVSTHNDAIYYFSKMADAGNSFQPRNLEATEPYIVSRKNCSYSLINLKTGVVKYHRLGKNQDVLDEFGNKVPVGYDAICCLPAYIVSCSNSRKCTDAATIMSTSLTRSKTRNALANLSRTATKA